MEIVVVERSFEQAADLQALAAAEEGVAWCLKTYRITPKISYVSSDGRRLICTYEAPDAESVRKANDTAGLPYDRIWTARVSGS